MDALRDREESMTWLEMMERGVGAAKLNDLLCRRKKLKPRASMLHGYCFHAILRSLSTYQTARRGESNILDTVLACADPIVRFAPEHLVSALHASLLPQR